MQQRAGRFYWSGRFEDVLRKHGVIPLDRSRFVVATRGQDLSAAQLANGALVEGPLTEVTARALGIGAAPRVTEAVELSAGDRRLGWLEYSSWTLAAKDPVSGRISTPYRLEPDDAGYHAGEIEYQALSAPEGWRPVLWAAASSAPEVVGVSDGTRLVLGLPLLDTITSMCAWPPFTDGYRGLASKLMTPDPERWLISELKRHVISAGETWTRIHPWPVGRSWAVTVRHDYDRLITDRQLSALLDSYDEFGVRSTWCLLTWKSPSHQARMLRGRGHEVALHTTGRDLAAFEDEVTTMRIETGATPAGCTAHGGTHVGFLGSRQHDWAESVGMDYGETIGRDSHFPYRRVAVVDGEPVASRLMLTAAHRSLDAGTGPDQHHLDKMLSAHKAIRRAGGHFILMNHPDVHGDELRAVLTDCELDDAWCATLLEVADWTAVTKYETAWRSTPDGPVLALGAPRRHGLLLEVEQAGEEPFAIEVAPDATSQRVARELAC